MAISNKEKGELGIEVMHNICVWFDSNEIMTWNDFVNIQKNRHKDLDKAINK